MVLHFVHEWVMLANLMLLLVGFAILAHDFEKSNLPHALPKLLPHGWVGGVVLLAIVFCMSAFLDNIAAAVIGGVVARHVYSEILEHPNFILRCAPTDVYVVCNPQTVWQGTVVGAFGPHRLPHSG